MNKDTIVLTGATSGFGAAALKIIASECDNPIVVGARSLVALNEEYGKRVTAIPLDLESFQSVKHFCDQISDVRIGSLAMNAGITTNKVRLTQDGFDRTFQTNYLAHFYIFQLLLNQLTQSATVVTTGSGTHDPEEKAPPPPPRHANVKLLANPYTDSDRHRIGPRAALHSYTASKLCCIMMASQIATRHPSLRCVSFDPGLVLETNLTREFPSFMVAIMKRIMPLMLPRDRVGSLSSTALAYANTVIGKTPPSENGGYLAMRNGITENVAPSELARDRSVGEMMWVDTIKLLDQKTPNQG